tara:strand:+ start:127 stop:528 length:402 start_codon:yes stop_codon:yes gene_type:complete
MAPNILVNDGGAPARIMKLGLANENMDAGTMVTIDGDGDILASGLDALPGVELQILGILFVDAVSGEPCSVITGSGIMVYLKVGSGSTIAAGHGLSHDATGLATICTASDMRVAIALEAEDATNTGYVKALLI